MKNKNPIPQPRSPSKSSTTFKNIVSEKEHGFSLVELIIVIIIVGILAAVGISQYSLTVEKARTAEAKLRLGTLRQLVQEYWLDNGTLNGISDSSLGIDDTCRSTDYYRYKCYGSWGTSTVLAAARCTSGGKTPNTNRAYTIQIRYYPGTGVIYWYCSYANDGSACFGMWAS